MLFPIEFGLHLLDDHQILAQLLHVALELNLHIFLFLGDLWSCKSEIASSHEYLVFKRVQVACDCVVWGFYPDTFLVFCIPNVIFESIFMV